MLDIETFTKGIAILENCYRNLSLSNQEIQVWYDIMKPLISEENFTSLIIHYCQSQPAPNGPSDLINFGKAKRMDNSPSSTIVIHALVDCVERMLSSNFMYGSPTVEQKKEQVLCDILMHYPALREDCAYSVIILLVKDWYVVIEDTIHMYDPRALSILKSELKTAYRTELEKAVSHVAISGSLLETDRSLLLES